MIPRINRLPAVIKLKNPRFFSSDLLTVRYSKNQAGVSRFRFIVSKKTCRLAVERNATRRKVRACIERLEIEKGLDIVIVIKRNVSKVSSQEICKDVQHITKEAGLSL